MHGIGGAPDGPFSISPKEVLFQKQGITMRKIASYPLPRSGVLFLGGADTDDRHLSMWACVKLGAISRRSAMPGYSKQRI
jgi:hypothetical protein